jgi:hypothetical protein
MQAELEVMTPDGAQLIAGMLALIASLLAFLREIFLAVGCAREAMRASCHWIAPSPRLALGAVARAAQGQVTGASGLREGLVWDRVGTRA